MKRFAVLLAVVAAALAVAVPAFADDAAPAAAPVGNTTTKKVDVSVFADTITSTRGDVLSKKGCSATSNFVRKQRVVWRMWAVDAASGKPITADDVKYVYIKIPGQANMNLTYGKHGSLSISPYFWSLGWAVPADYPLGTVDYKIVMKLKDGRFGYYTQPADGTAMLTVTG